MAQVYALDNVIRRLHDSEAAKIRASITQKVVIIEQQKKKVLLRKPLFGGNIEFFLVLNSSAPGNVANSNLTIDLRNFDTDIPIAVSGRYQVSCPPGNEEMVALALSEGNSPGSAFERKITSWIKEYSETRFDEFSTNYNEHFSNLQKDVERRVKEEIGLSIKLKLYLKQDDLRHLRAFSIESTYFPVSVCDYDSKVNFRFNTNLLIKENGEVSAILSFRDISKLEDIIKEETDSFVRKNVSLYDFCYKFIESVHPNLVKHLNTILANYGRQIEYFNPEIDQSILMPDSFSIKHDVRCQIQEYPELVVINNILEVEPHFESIVNYRKAQVSDLQTWFRETLDKVIQRLLFDYNYINLLLEFDQVVLAIKEKLGKEAERIGYSMRLITTVSDQLKPLLKPLPVESSDFRVLVNDYEQEIAFRFTTNLVLSENGEKKAFLNRNFPLEELLKNETRKYLRKNVSLYDFCYKFIESVHPNLVKHLDTILANYGRQIEYFNPEIDQNILMPDSFSIKHNVKCEIQEYPDPIYIKNTLEVEPCIESILKYKKAQISDLQAWFRGKLDRIVQRLLFDCKYIDILLDFEPIGLDIKNELKEEAEKIGYSIRLITTVPDLKPLIWKTEGFKVATNETFATKENNVKVKLSIDVHGKIENLRNIKDLLNARLPVDDLIESKVVDTVSQALHNVEPDDFYFYFEYGDISVKSTLIEEIEKALENEFHASSVKVTLKRLDTELTQRFKVLTSKPCEFEVKIASFRDFGEPVEYNVSFSVNGVAKDKWNMFQSRECTLEDLSKYLEKQLPYWFSTFKSETLIYQTLSQSEKLRENANTLARKYIVDEFGLLITIWRFSRKDTESQKNIRALQIQHTVEQLAEAQEQITNDAEWRKLEKEAALQQVRSLQQELKEVSSYLQDILVQEGNENEVSELEYKKSKLQQKVSELLKQIRNESSEIAKQRIQSSVPLPSEEDDLDALVTENKALLSDSNLNSQSQSATRRLQSIDEVIDVQSEE
jgi:ElaB/YqjD/DUF883 family membrane-anchored ribosome-binding protein